MSSRTLYLLVAATVMSGLLAGGNVDRALFPEFRGFTHEVAVQAPAKSLVGADDDEARSPDFPFLHQRMREVPGGLEITPVGRTFVRNIAMVYDIYFTKNRSGKQPTFSRTI